MLICSYILMHLCTPEILSERLYQIQIRNQFTGELLFSSVMNKRKFCLENYIQNLLVVYYNFS